MLIGTPGTLHRECACNWEHLVNAWGVALKSVITIPKAKLTFAIRSECWDGTVGRCIRSNWMGNLLKPLWWSSGHWQFPEKHEHKAACTKGCGHLFLAPSPLGSHLCPSPVSLPWTNVTSWKKSALQHKCTIIDTTGFYSYAPPRCSISEGGSQVTN